MKMTERLEKSMMNKLSTMARVVLFGREMSEAANHAEGRMCA